MTFSLFFQHDIIKKISQNIQILPILEFLPKTCETKF